MRRRPHPRFLQTSAKGWGWLILVGAILLPLSPVLALAGMFLFAFLHDRISRAYAQWKVDHRRDYRELLEDEIRKRKEQNKDNERTD